MARIDPLPASEWSPEMREALAKMSPPNARYALISGGRPRGLNILGAIAHHPRLAKAFFTLQGHLLLTTSLTERQRELVIMRAAAVRRSEYEWAQHLYMAHDAGLSDLEISWVIWGPDAPTWSPGDASLLRAVDDLVLEGAIKESTWPALAQHLDAQQILDLIFTAGSYTMLASMLDSLGIELDEELSDGVADLTGRPARSLD